MIRAPIPTAYVVRSSSPHARSLLFGARAALAVVFGLWPLSATMVTVAAMLVSL